MERRAKAMRSRNTDLVFSDRQSIEKGRVGLGPSPSLMDFDAFREFLAGICRWAVSDAPTPPEKNDKDQGYFGSYNRAKAVSLSPWGAGNPTPADHEFMQRLFKRWDVTGSSELTLSNVVTGLAHIKGSQDVMGSITYFFELYDDDGDGKVDREGILRISEALLFLSRRGLEGSLEPSPTPGVNGSGNGNGLGAAKAQGQADERFLSSVSAFIRRCFEYADPDRPHESQSQPDLINIEKEDPEVEEDVKSEPGLQDPDSFGIGSDSDEDLLDMDGNTDSKPAPISKIATKPLPKSPMEQKVHRVVSRQKSEAANADRKSVV